MALLMKPMTQSASRRAAAADPNARRCLVENCSTQKGVQLAHVFKRENSSDSSVMRSLEWNWGMTKNTLNLDTKGNTFFVGASLHELYKGRKWVLLPEDSAVYQYYDKNKITPLKRAQYPISQAQQYQYTMLPLQDMDDIYLTRQSTDPDAMNEITIHDYPFESLPILTSHINPRYAILQVGDVVYRDLRLAERRALHKKYPILRKIDILYTKWRGELGDVVEQNPNFVPVALVTEMGQELPSKNSVSSGESVSTPLRRISPVRAPRVVRPSHETSSPTSSSSRPTSALSGAPPIHQCHEVSSKKRPSHGGKAERERRKRKRLMLLTSKALEMLEDELEESDSEDDGGWSVERISSWAQGCIISPLTSESDGECSTKNAVAV